ncbi:tyrosine-protein phosphatase [Comamonas sp. NoAH]|uniref:tyrosine-protein phosphatase n=1 Tax=Comamonas halotolerans TaxID=3041496 RepID=UPI0024E13C50|nr:tyrosine-protein phosphatase [Comamonas sp. NoAH]
MTLNPPARHIALPGTTNFRDLGGYVGHGGRSVRWRTLFRSDHLADLTDEGLRALQGLGVRRSADFRGVQERTTDAYAWEGVQTHALTVEPTVVQKALALIHAGGSMTAEDSVALMQETYRHFVRDNAAQFAQLFQLLLQEDAPTVIHCTAGKDRTGWAAALILETLGVARTDIERDYLLTNQYYQRPAAMAARAAQSVPQDILNVLWRVQPEFLASAYEMVERDYGDMPTYLREAMQLDESAQNTLRARYLQA